MRTTSQLAVAAVLAVTALSVQAGPRMESAVSPFTYEALGATPVVTFARTRAAKAVEAPAADAVRKAAAPASRAAGTAAFTYDALGATPRVEVRKPVKAEAQAPAAAH